MLYIYFTYFYSNVHFVDSKFLNVLKIVNVNGLSHRQSPCFLDNFKVSSQSPRTTHTENIGGRSRTNESFVRVQVITMLFGTKYFSANRPDGSTDKNFSVSRLHPPYGVNVSGVKEPCSIFTTRSPYGRSFSDRCL